MGNKLFHPIRVAFDMLSVGPTKGYELVRQRKLTIVKIGNKSLAADSEVKALAEELLQEARSKKAA